MTAPMGLPTQEELQKEVTQEETSQSPTSSEETPKQDTPPISTPSEDERDKLIREQMNLIASMKRKLDELATPSYVAPPTPKPSEAELNKEFWENPVGLLRKEMEAMVAPIKDHIGKTIKKDAYTELKDKFKQDPRFKIVLERAENYVDQLMANQQPTEANLQAILYGIRGAAALGDIPVSFDEVKEEPPAKKKDMSSMLPPHLKPSAPPAQKNTDESKKLRPLTELEKRLARENRMSEEEYLEMMELKPEEVTNYKKEKK